MKRLQSGLIVAAVLTVALWLLNLAWLQKDTRPPVWDMALHQTYALNYLDWMQGAAPPAPAASWSGNYPPFVHLLIALLYAIFHPGPHMAALVNLPASFLLFWSVYMLGARVAGECAARWACLLTALTPYLIWLSRETVLDYWLSAWVAAGLVALLRTEGFKSHAWSLLFGLICALGLLTKWFYAAFLFFPVVYTAIRFRIWRDRLRMLHLADAILICGVLAGVWYVPNLQALTRFFLENAQVGALEGEPPQLSFQSWIYYLRLLEGYQLFALLFVVLFVSALFVWKRQLVREGTFMFAAICGGWLVMTLLRTKDPRFTMPLLGPMLILAGAWIASLPSAWWGRFLKLTLAAVLLMQAYAANFGIRWLPQEVILMRGYTGGLRWDWNLYLQHYFHILGAPRREDWKQEEILRQVSEHARNGQARPHLALIPDLPRFNTTNFNLIARLRNSAVQVDQLRNEVEGLRAFNGFDYAVMTERDQGVSHTTVQSSRLNQIIVDAPRVFQLISLHILPDGNCARLYYIRRESAAAPDGPQCGGGVAPEVRAAAGRPREVPCAVCETGRNAEELSLFLRVL
jgi:4-amino-4-deoxy-L-arabinose transferase-like glycosyltransferase